MMTDYTDLLRDLRAHGMSDSVVRLCADAIEALQAECERLRAKVEVAEAGYQSAVSKAQWQASTNSELNRLFRQRNELGVECERLRYELAAAQKDAERYRWLRKHPINGLEETTPCIRAAENDLKHWALTGDDADAAIDAAMAQEKL